MERKHVWERLTTRGLYDILSSWEGVTMRRRGSKFALDGSFYYIRMARTSEKGTIICCLRGKLVHRPGCDVGR